MAVGEVLVYVGAATGVIGTCTGIFGAVMGVIAYRRAGELKSIDLRLELGRLDVDLQHVIAELPILLGNAKKSREDASPLKADSNRVRVFRWRDAKEAVRTCRLNSATVRCCSQF